MAQRLIFLGAAGAVLLAARIAWTQQPQQPPAPVGPPQPTPVVLTPARAEAAALARARQDPLAARLRGVMAQDRATAPVLTAIQASDVPVLGPADPSVLRTARFYPGDRQYVLVVRRPGQIIEIFGATKALQPPAGVTIAPPPRPSPNLTRVAPADAARAQAAQAGLSVIRSEQTEYGFDVSFSRFGAAYNVSFICDSVGPPDCTEASAIAFAAQLQLLGGAQ